ncbi:unnamed protein product [Arabidopsis thaliana]|uniref:(thale cress) hypothetical protein n=1 Tax=Arabidopsis thaliana TaxID=3702 RepID=A0A7G2EYK4_ARATH|nr:unnamed protein product [Arabidopsis thaliana]
MCHPHDLDALRDFIANREQKLASINHDNTTKLELVNKKLSGKLSESVKKLDEIRVLNRSQNFIKDSIPISIFNLVNRQTLDLSSNDLSDEIPRILAWQQNYKSRLLKGNLTHSKAAPEAATDPLNHGGGFIPETQQRDTHASINVEKAETATKKRTKIPTIYYASRTHSQITQVIREYRKTGYRVPMAVLVGGLGVAGS